MIQILLIQLNLMQTELCDMNNENQTLELLGDHMNKHCVETKVGLPQNNESL